MSNIRRITKRLAMPDLAEPRTDKSVCATSVRVIDNREPTTTNGGNNPCV